MFIKFEKKNDNTYGYLCWYIAIIKHLFKQGKNSLKRVYMKAEEEKNNMANDARSNDGRTIILVRCRRTTCCSDSGFEGRRSSIRNELSSRSAEKSSINVPRFFRAAPIASRLFIVQSLVDCATCKCYAAT